MLEENRFHISRRRLCFSAVYARSDSENNPYTNYANCELGSEHVYNELCPYFNGIICRFCFLTYYLHYALLPKHSE